VTGRASRNPERAGEAAAERAGAASGSWATSPATRRAMQGNRRRDTRPELAIRRLVHASGLRYRVDAPPLPAARYKADMIFARARVAVFIDGCWWHGCEEHYRPPASNTAYWAAKIARNRERDRLADQALAVVGWTVIRIWEHEAPESAAGRIEAAVRVRPAGPWPGPECRRGDYCAASSPAHRRRHERGGSLAPTVRPGADSLAAVTPAGDRTGEPLLRRPSARCLRSGDCDDSYGDPL